MLHNLFISHKMPFIYNFIFFCSSNIFSIIHAIKLNTNLTN